MRNTKRYTNQTFTKRVDHEGGGEHRVAENQKEPAVCDKCGAVYENCRWTAKAVVHKADELKHWKPESTIRCPACIQIEQGVVGGYVSLSGTFLQTHREEIEHLLKNEEARAREDNPLSRIMNWREQENGGVTIETTNEHLAQRFGHVLEKAYDGQVKYDFSHENKVARVSWHRD
ncbi:MAG TPA: BCAM0308 family protein [Pyrinomonadaceae bacterium]|nr:BCAM0308 family protein [Pyrinomonadaceae bacterium]